MYWPNPKYTANLQGTLTYLTTAVTFQPLARTFPTDEIKYPSEHSLALCETQPPTTSDRQSLSLSDRPRTRRKNIGGLYPHHTLDYPSYVRSYPRRVGAEAGHNDATNCLPHRTRLNPFLRELPKRMGSVVLVVTAHCRKPHKQRRTPATHKCLLNYSIYIYIYTYIHISRQHSSNIVRRAHVEGTV